MTWYPWTLVKGAQTHAPVLWCDGETHVVCPLLQYLLGLSGPEQRILILLPSVKGYGVIFFQFTGEYWFSVSLSAPSAC